MRQFCGPYFLYTANGAFTTRPFIEPERPLESAWAAQVIINWRRRLARRRAA